jgi:hypothetical protein
LKNQILDVENDEIVKEFIQDQLKIFNDNLRNFVKSRKKQGKNSKSKKKNSSTDLSKNLKSLRTRIGRVRPDNYGELYSLVRIKVAQIVDDLGNLADDGVIGVERYNALVTAIESTFNPNNREFNIKLMRKDFERMYYDFIDELKLEELE